MPYIRPELRNKVDVEIDALSKAIIATADEDSIEGILNYTFTSLLSTITLSSKPSWRYKLINRVMGMLECVKFEFYRRLAGPYEDKAIKSNGDISTYDSF